MIFMTIKSINEYLGCNLFNNISVLIQELCFSRSYSCFHSRRLREQQKRWRDQDLGRVHRYITNSNVSGSIHGVTRNMTPVLPSWMLTQNHLSYEHFYADHPLTQIPSQFTVLSPTFPALTVYTLLLVPILARKPFLTHSCYSSCRQKVTSLPSL